MSDDESRSTSTARTSKSGNTLVSNQCFDMSCPQMSFTGDLSAKWKDWHAQFKVFLLAAGLTKESDARKNALLIKCMGKQAFTIFKSFELDVETE